jgi:hypothetical protein
MMKVNSIKLKFKNRFATLIVMVGAYLFSSFSFAAALDFSADRLRIENYYRGIVTSYLDTVIPKGTYYVDVQAVLFDSKLRQYFQEKKQKFEVPLSGTLLGFRGIETATEKPAALTFEETLPFVKSKIIRLGLSAEVNAESRKWIQDKLSKDLKLQIEKGDELALYDLPADFTQGWANWFKKVQPFPETPIPIQPVVQKESTPIHWSVIVLGILGVALLGFFVFGFQSFRNLMAGELTKLSQSISASAPGQSSLMQSSGALSSALSGAGSSAMGQSLAATGIRTSTSDSFSREIGPSKILEKLDVNTLKMIALDCSASASHRYFASAMIFSHIDQPNLALEFEKSIADEFKPFPLQGEAFPSRAQIEQWIVPYYPQYKTLSKSPFAMDLASQPVEWLNELALVLNPAECVLLMDLLPPLKMKLMLDQVTLKKRIEWSKVSIESWDETAKQHHLSILVAVFNEFKSKLPRIPVQKKKQNEQSYRKNMLLAVHSFDQEEQLYESTLDDAKKGISVYTGILSYLGLNDTEVWGSLDARDLACATFGYSEAMREQIAQMLPGKKGEWYRNFCNKLSASPLPYESDAVVLAQNSILMRLSAVLKVQDLKKQKTNDPDSNHDSEAA